MDRRRIEGLDFLRGLAILFMVFFHNFQFYEGELNSVADSLEGNPIAQIVEFISRWASIFAVISCYAHAVQIGARYHYKQEKFAQIFKEAVITGLWLIFLERVLGAFFSRPSRGGGLYDFDEGPTQHSILTSWIATGSFHLPTFYSMVYAVGALNLMGWSLILSTLLLGILFRNKGIKRPVRNIIIIFTVAVTILIISPVLIEKLRPLWIEAMMEDKIALALFYGFFVGDAHPILPFFGYALFGTIFGIATSAEIPRKKMAAFGLTTGSVGIVLGTVGYIRYGAPPVAHILRTVAPQTMWLQIGCMLWLITAVYWVHFTQKPSLGAKIFHSTFIRRFGLISLTMYLLEGFFSTILKRLIDIVIPGWATNMPAVVIFSFSTIIIYWQALKGWEKVDFKYSADWLTVKVVGALTGHKSAKMQVRNILYSPRHFFLPDSKNLLSKNPKSEIL